MSQTPKIIPFIGFLAGAISLIRLPSNLGKPVWTEVVIVMVSAGAACAIYTAEYNFVNSRQI